MMKPTIARLDISSDADYVDTWLMIEIELNCFNDRQCPVLQQEIYEIVHKQWKKKMVENKHC